MKNTSKFNVRVSAISIAIGSLFIAQTAFADDSDIKELTQPKSSVQVEMIGVDQNSAKFGEYNGLSGHPSGAYPNGALSIRGGDAYTNNEQGGTMRWSVSGDNLGLTSRSANASVADQGSWNIGINYDQLQHNITDSYQTPYKGTMGQNQFTLPTGPTGIGMTGQYTNILSQSQTSSALQGMSISSTRYNTTVSGGAIVDKNLNFTFEYNNLLQSGAKLQGVSGASNPSSPGYATTGVANSNSGNAQTVSILPMPTNYRTDTLNLAVNWKGDNSHLTASYFGSFFTDGFDQFNFQAWNKTSQQTQTPMQTMSTMPSNYLNQINLSGGYDFSAKTKLTGNASIGQNIQNQGFAGTYDAGMAQVTSTTNYGALPAASFNGLVNTTHADLKVTDQTFNDLMLSAAAKFDERDNLSQSNMYTAQSVSSTPKSLYLNYAIPNTPMSLKQTQLILGGDYKLTRDQKIGLTLANNNINRWCNQYGSQAAGTAAYYYNSPNCVAATSSNENKIDANYKLKIADGLNFKAGAGYSNRKTNWDSSVYVGMPNQYTNNQNSANFNGFYPFFEASRKQYLGKAGVNWDATERLSFGLGGKYTSEIYPDSQLGVQNGNSWSLNLDSTYAYADEGSMVFYATQQSQQRNMLNGVGDSSSATANTGTWNNNLQTNTTTLGLGAKQGGLLSGKLVLNGDLTYSMARSAYATQQNYGTTCSDPTVATCGILPGIVNNLAIIKVGGVYQLDKNSKIGLQYWFQHLYSSDFLYNAYQFGATPSGVMPTNQTSPSYSVNVISANYVYTFD